MFAPKEFQEHELGVLHDLIEETRLGTLLTALPGAPPCGSHVPFLLDRARGSNGVLIGHVDRRNPQWRVLRGGEEALVTFLGPDAGVSAGWYGTKPRVPTWLYVAVHCTGRATMVEDAEGLRRMVVRLSEANEGLGSGWSPSQVEPYIDKLLRGIVGFEIPIARIEGQVRMGQHNSPDDQRRVHAVLDAGTPRQRRTAEMMRRFGRFEDAATVIAPDG